MVYGTGIWGTAPYGGVSIGIRTGSVFEFSNNELTGETWTIEKYWIDFTLSSSILTRTKQLEITISNPYNTREDRYFKYQRVRIKERATNLVVFFGRVEMIEPQSSLGGDQTLKITAYDYMTDLTARTLNSNYVAQTRSAIVADIITNYTYINNLTQDIESSGSSETVNRDYVSSSITGLKAIEELAIEDPWSDSSLGACWLWDNSGGAYVDNTAAASGAGVFVFLDDTADYRYYGLNNPHWGLDYILTVNGDYSGLLYEYYDNNGAWTTLHPSEVYRYDVNGEIKIVPPDDWSTFTITNGVPHAAAPPDAVSRFYLRVSASTITAQATIDTITVKRGFGYDYFVDENQVFTYRRRGSWPTGGAKNNGLTIKYLGTAGSQEVIMAGDYKFPEYPKEIVTRVTVIGEDALGVAVSGSATNTALETELNLYKEERIVISTVTSNADCALKADALLDLSSEVAKRGAVSFMGWPKFRAPIWYLVRAGDLVHIDCSLKSLTQDYIVLEIVYEEPSTYARLKLLGRNRGRTYLPFTLEFRLEDLTYRLTKLERI